MRLVYTLLLAAAVAGATAYFVRPTTGTAGQETAFERVVRTNTIRCGYYTWPGMIEKDVNTGEMKGFLSTLMPVLAKELGVKIEWTEEVAYDQMMQGLLTQRYDVLCSPITDLPSRARAGLFTQPLFFWPTHAYVRSNSPYTSVSQLNQPKVRFAGLEGDFSETFGRQAFPLAQHLSISGAQGFIQAFLDVASNKADVILNEPYQAGEFMAHNPGKIKQLPGEPIYLAPIVFAVGTNEWQLQQYLDAGIRSMHAQGLVNKLVAADKGKATIVIPVAKPYGAK